MCVTSAIYLETTVSKYNPTHGITDLQCPGVSTLVRPRHETFAEIKIDTSFPI